MYWTSITRLLHHLRTEKARLTIWLFTSGITFLLLYFFWEPKVRSFPEELVRIERMADTRPAAALQELERYDTTECMPGAIIYYHFIALKTRYQLQPAYRIAPLRTHQTRHRLGIPGPHADTTGRPLLLCG